MKHKGISLLFMLKGKKKTLFIFEIILNFVSYIKSPSSVVNRSMSVLNEKNHIILDSTKIWIQMDGRSLTSEKPTSAFFLTMAKLWLLISCFLLDSDHPNVHFLISKLWG